MNGQVNMGRRDVAAVPRLAPDEARIRAKSELLKDELRGCGGRDLEMLIRYYVGGQDMDRVVTEMDVSREEIEQLIGRLRAIASCAGARGAGCSG